ncbi:transposase [Streptomyces ossamyceticus]|uniref:Transposase n=1 Tax=Streptomyces ossamyceticus TaxID=249581 RepID=A0ABV2V3C2_9ACTN
MDHLLTTIGHHFGRVEPRRRMRDYVRALLAPVPRKNSWQLAEHAGHATPDGLQHLLSRASWNPDDIRDDLQTYVAEHLGRPDGVLIIDDTGHRGWGSAEPTHLAGRRRLCTRIGFLTFCNTVAPHDCAAATTRPQGAGLDGLVPSISDSIWGFSPHVRPSFPVDA